MADICHNAPGLPDASAKRAANLSQYIGERQTDALRLETLLDAAITCMDGKHNELLFALIDAAHDEAKALNGALDCSNLPKGGAS